MISFYIFLSYISNQSQIRKILFELSFYDTFQNKAITAARMDAETVSIVALSSVAVSSVAF